tara:strand:+ start:447 stop:1151 length:705 start_codon:yes stop_codon:yes gene_type:complete
MSDVRLTALNPDDSSPVPVACDAAGKLLLEDVPAFDGNLDGDLTVTGTGEFGGGVRSINGNAGSNKTAFVQIAGSSAQGIQLNNGTTTTTQLSWNGSVTFAGGNVEIGTASYLKVFDTTNNLTAALCRSTAGQSYGLTIAPADNENNLTASIKADGTAEFSGGKAGFTAEGYLWCTTQSGQTVILVSTTNGLATWAAYTPPSLRDLIKEKAEAWAEKDTNDPDFGVSRRDNGET